MTVIENNDPNSAIGVVYFDRVLQTVFSLERRLIKTLLVNRTRMIRLKSDTTKLKKSRFFLNFSRFQDIVDLLCNCRLVIWLCLFVKIQDLTLVKRAS